MTNSEKRYYFSLGAGMGPNIGSNQKSSKSRALTLRLSTNEFAKCNKRPWGGENVLEHLSMKLTTVLQYFSVCQ